MSLVHSFDIRGIRDCLVIEYPVHNRRSFARVKKREALLSLRYNRHAVGGFFTGETPVARGLKKVSSGVKRRRVKYF